MELRDSVGLCRFHASTAAVGLSGAEHAYLAQCKGQQVKTGFSGGAVIGLADRGKNSCFSASTSGNWLLFRVQSCSPCFRLL